MQQHCYPINTWYPGMYNRLLNQSIRKTCLHQQQPADVLCWTWPVSPDTQHTLSLGTGLANHCPCSIDSYNTSFRCNQVLAVKFSLEINALGLSCIILYQNVHKMRTNKLTLPLEQLMNPVNWSSWKTMTSDTLMP